MGRPPRKKRAIERAALELFVEKGVDGTSIRDIALRAGVTEGALYRHHRSKNDLVTALFFENYEGFAEVIRNILYEEQKFDPRIHLLVNSFFELYDQDPYIFHFIMIVHHRLLDDVRADEKNPVELLSRILRKARDGGEIPPQNTDRTTQMLLGMMLQTAVGHHHGRIHSTLVDHADYVARACILVAKNGEGNGTG